MQSPGLGHLRQHSLYALSRGTRGAGLGDVPQVQEQGGLFGGARAGGAFPGAGARHAG